jgi:hypothetical protein
LIRLLSLLPFIGLMIVPFYNISQIAEGARRRYLRNGAQNAKRDGNHGPSTAIGRSLGHHDERLAFFDDIRGEFRTVVTADVPR